MFASALHPLWGAQSAVLTPKDPPAIQKPVGGAAFPPSVIYRDRQLRQACQPFLAYPCFMSSFSPFTSFHLSHTAKPQPPALHSKCCKAGATDHTLQQRGWWGEAGEPENQLKIWAELLMRILEFMRPPPHYLRGSFWNANLIGELPSLKCFTHSKQPGALHGWPLCPLLSLPLPSLPSPCLCSSYTKGIGKSRMIPALLPSNLHPCPHSAWNTLLHTPQPCSWRTELQCPGDLTPGLPSQPIFGGLPALGHSRHSL